MLIWSGVENGFLVDEFYDEGRRLLAEARDAFPGNPVLPQYDGAAWTPSIHAEGQGQGQGQDQGQGAAWTPRDTAKGQQGGRGEWDWVQPQQARRRMESLFMEY